MVVDTETPEAIGLKFEIEVFKNGNDHSALYCDG